ncbi:hypothetical protein [Herbiconiux liangxiaofengii]
MQFRRLDLFPREAQPALGQQLGEELTLGSAVPFAKRMRKFR